MAKSVANANGRFTLSIHGNCIVSGDKHDRPYNSNPQENQPPTTARGKRRLTNKKK